MLRTHPSTTLQQGNFRGTIPDALCLFSCFTSQDTLHTWMYHSKHSLNQSMTGRVREGASWLSHIQPLSCLLTRSILLYQFGCRTPLSIPVKESTIDTSPKTNICANSSVHIKWIHSPIDSSGLITQHTFLVQKWTVSALNCTHCPFCHLESWGLWFIKHTLHWRYTQWLFECRQYHSIIQKAVLDPFSLSVCEENSSSVLEGVNI